jgi:histidinol dehydrogenase
MAIRIIKARDPLRSRAVARLRDALRGGGLTASARGGGRESVARTVTAILRKVASGGDRELVRLAERYDKAALTPKTLRVPPAAIRAATAAAETKFLALARRVIANIRQYQEHILIRPPAPLLRGGRELGVRYTPVDSVGVYVPGGRALYPSTMLMTIVPAQVAGVRRIAIASPPNTAGEVNPMVLALAGELGIGEVYRLGGAQAIAAMAMGTESIAPVDKIVGPGNAYVTEAKRQVFGRVGIDSTAGPSEVLIVADDTAAAEQVAADLLAQAEHDPGSAILVTPSEKLAKAVAAEVKRQLPALARAAAGRACLRAYGAIIVVADLPAACAAANEFAPEHLQIITADDQACLGRIRNAGAIFLGADTPVPLGDYYAGPSHVLPTGGTARFFGPLSCNDFLKASSVLGYDAASLAADADDVIDFATREGLTAHAAAIDIRRKKN